MEDLEATPLTSASIYPEHDDCDHLVQDAIQREDEEARARTVRRGWNRTAGSRYAFAADGVTFESSGGI